MVADGWLGEPKCIGQVADTRLPSWLGLDQTQDAKSSRIAQDAQHRRQPGGRLVVQRRAREQGRAVENRQWNGAEARRSRGRRDGAKHIDTDRYEWEHAAHRCPSMRNVSI